MCRMDGLMRKAGRKVVGEIDPSRKGGAGSSVSNQGIHPHEHVEMWVWSSAPPKVT
jgi:hypothetical protein